MYQAHFFCLLALASWTPVWIVSDQAGGFVLSWRHSGGGPTEVVVNEAGRTTTHTLDRGEGAIVIPRPNVPYSIGYRVKGGAVIPLTARSQASKARANPADRTHRIRVAFNTGVETANLRAPVTTRHIAPSDTKGVDLFIKVNPAGAVAGASTPYYQQEDLRALARAATETAIRSWRFEPSAGSTYRDARLRLNFYTARTTIRSN
jgi:hypothetical protein